MGRLANYLDPRARLNMDRCDGERSPVLAHPVRTCVGCRTRDHQGDLLRVVRVDGRLVPDFHRERSGRGAYVHPSQGCVRAAIARKAFGRALRAGGPLDPTELVAAVEELTESKVEERRDAHPMNSQR